MRRVLVIGSGGAGKSTFSRRLGEALGIQVIHLDAHYWNPGWVATPDDVWHAKVEELTESDSWVMDGNYSGTLDVRLAACDSVIVLDPPRLTCLARIIKRRFAHRNASRPDMAPGCPEKLDLAFIWWVWTYPARSKKRTAAKLARVADVVDIHYLRTDSESDDFLRDLIRGQELSATRSTPG